MNLNQELADCNFPMEYKSFWCQKFSYFFLVAAQNKQLMIKYEQNVKSAGEIEEATRELQQSYQITLDSSLSAVCWMSKRGSWDLIIYFANLFCSMKRK